MSGFILLVQKICLSVTGSIQPRPGVVLDKNVLGAMPPPNQMESTEGG